MSEAITKGSPWLRAVLGEVVWTIAHTRDTVSHHTVVVCCAAKPRARRGSRESFYNGMTRRRITTYPGAQTSFSAREYSWVRVSIWAGPVRS